MHRSTVLRSGALALGIAFAGLALQPPARAQARVVDAVDLDMVSRIRQEGLQRSQVMATLDHLTDRIGPRLTNSAAYARASQWTRTRLAEWACPTCTRSRWATSAAAGSSTGPRC